MSRIPLVLLACVLALAPFAAADSISLTTNNLGVSGSVATANITQLGANQVLVTIDANSGFGLKVNGGRVFLNTSLGLPSASISALTIVAGGQTYTGLNFSHMKTDQNVSSLGTFTDVFFNLQGGPHGITNASQISFIITAPGLTAQNLFNPNATYQLGVHFCESNETHCEGPTGFAAGHEGGMTSVPEPGTLSLIGTGLVGLFGVARRKLNL